VYDRQLRALIAIEEMGSMSRAAAQMYVSVPALKKQMDTLEAELGVQLFVRSNQGVAFTQAGEAFCACARETIALLDRGVAQAQMLQTRDKDIILIGYDNALVKEEVLSNALFEWHQKEPDVNISIERCTKFDFHQYDLFLGANYQQGQEVVIHYLCELPLTCILPKNHLLAGKRAITVEELTLYPALLPPREMLVIGAPQFVEIIEQTGSRAVSFVKLKESYEKHMYESLTANKIGVMIGFETHVDERLVQIPLEGYTFHYRIYSSKAKDKPNLRLFIDFLKDYYPRKCAEMCAQLGLNV